MREGEREWFPRPVCAGTWLAGLCSGLCEVRIRKTWFPELSLLRRKGSPPSNPKPLEMVQVYGPGFGRCRKGRASGVKGLRQP